MGLVGCGRGPVGAAGGVEKVWLVPVGGITACRYDAAAGGYTEVVLRKGACFARYDFAEDTASYRQYVSGEHPMSCIVHELSFAFHGTGRDAAAAVDGLAASGGRGGIGAYGRGRRVAGRLVARVRRGMSFEAC